MIIYFTKVTQSRRLRQKAIGPVIALIQRDGTLKFIHVKSADSSVIHSVMESFQKQRDGISTLMTEIAALRDSVCEIGPHYEPILARHRAAHTRTAKRVANAVMLAHDEIVQ